MLEAKITRQGGEVGHELLNLAFSWDLLTIIHKNKEYCEPYPLVAACPMLSNAEDPFPMSHGEIIPPYTLEGI